MRRLILSSSQSKRPIGTDPWVRATLEAVEKSVRQGHELVASLGLTSWELALWRAASCGARVHLVCPTAPRADRTQIAERILTAFAMRSDRVVWHWVTAKSPGRKSAWALRDQVALYVADEVVEVSVRPSGRLAKLLSGYGRRRDATFSVKFESNRRTAGWERRAPSHVPSLWGDGALVHLTRASDGPWPGEPNWRYYEDVAASAEYPRSGFATLLRIVREGRIRGSKFRACGGLARVCLTACSPEEVPGLIRFRARYGRYSFEPYGVVLSAQAAHRVGAKPVAYEAGRRPDPLRQGPGRDGHWMREKEWRVLGDIELAGLAPGDVTVVVATDAEARAMEAGCRFPVVSFGYGEPGLSMVKFGRSGAPERAAAASKRV